MFDPSQKSPSGKTYAQIDAEEAEYVRAANAALASARGAVASWWSYSASHRTFEMVVGEPYAEDNVVLSLPACDYLAGPVRWSGQQVEVLWRCDRENARRPWEFELRDEAAGCRAVGEMFRWRRGHDLWAQDGLWFGRGAGPTNPLSLGEAQETLARLLRHFCNGLMGYRDLACRVEEVLSQLPLVKTSAVGGPAASPGGEGIGS